MNDIYKRTANDIVWSIHVEGTHWQENKIETRVGTKHISAMNDGRYPVDGSNRQLIVSHGRVFTRNVKAIVADTINKTEEGFDHIFVEGIYLLTSGAVNVSLGS